MLNGVSWKQEQLKLFFFSKWTVYFLRGANAWNVSLNTNTEDPSDLSVDFGHLFPSKKHICASDWFGELHLKHFGTIIMQIEKEKALCIRQSTRYEFRTRNNNLYSLPIIKYLGYFPFAGVRSLQDTFSSFLSRSCHSKYLSNCQLRRLVAILSRFSGYGKLNKEFHCIHWNVRTARETFN